jgi:hypothetical protein
VGLPAAGTVVLIPFPFSDLSRSKLRPAVVLAAADRDDLILEEVGILQAPARARIIDAVVAILRGPVQT